MTDFIYRSNDELITRKTSEWFTENVPMLDMLLKMNAADNEKEGKI